MTDSKIVQKKNSPKQKKRKTVQYDRWGYFFIAPFFLIFFVFSFIPLVTTFVYSFFENYRDGLVQVGPNASVPKYFNGTNEIYGWQLKACEDGIDELIVTYGNQEINPDFTDTVMNYLAPLDKEDPNYDMYTDSNFRRNSFEKKVKKVVEDGVKKGLPAKDVLLQLKGEVTKNQWSFFRNFQNVFASGDNIARYFLNTLIMWAIGFVPQILVSLILAVWFTNTELKLKFQQFFTTVIYMPNLIMASAFAMLFFTLFSPNGPIESIIRDFNAWGEARELSKTITGLFNEENIEAVKLWIGQNPGVNASVADLIEQGVINLQGTNISRNAVAVFLNNKAVPFSDMANVMQLFESKSLFFSDTAYNEAVAAYLGNGPKIKVNLHLLMDGLRGLNINDAVGWINAETLSQESAKWGSAFVEAAKQGIEPVRFFTRPGWTRVLIGVMNFLMWYGNTTILLMAGIMGIDNSLFEAARIDGASPLQVFFKVTIPLLLPIFVYVMITSLIGGIQMFDVPQILTKGSGAPNRTTMTIIMKLNNYLTISKNYGNAGVMSILIFAVTGVLSGLVYKMTMAQYKQK